MKETWDFLETRNSEECASTANVSPCQQDLAMRDASCVKKVARVGKSVLPILREMAEASGFKASLAALMGRVIEDRVLSVPPPPGTPLLCSLARVVEHSGIYLGAGRVAELKGDGQLREVSLSVFLNGDESDMYNPRKGHRIYAACDAGTGSPLF